MTRPVRNHFINEHSTCPIRPSTPAEIRHVESLSAYARQGCRHNSSSSFLDSPLHLSPPSYHILRPPKPIMNAATSNLVISLGAMQGTFNSPTRVGNAHRLAKVMDVLTCISLLNVVARKIDFDNPQVLLYVRIAYVAVQAFVLGTYYYTSAKVCMR